MTKVESIAKEHEEVMSSKWYQYLSYSVFATVISLVQSLFTKSEPPSVLAQQLPLSQPPLTPLLISNSRSMKITLPSSSNPSSASPPITSYPANNLFMDTKHPISLTNLGNKEQSVVDNHMPTTESLSNDHQEPSSASSVARESSSASDSQIMMMNPNIVQLFRDQELGKTLLTYVIPISIGVLTVYTKQSSSSSSLPIPSILLSLCIGLTALWNGILLRNTLPDTVANAMEQFGAACIFFAFFTVVSSLLQPNLVWVPWTCFAAILLPSILSCIPVGDKAQARTQ